MTPEFNEPQDNLEIDNNDTQISSPQSHMMPTIPEVEPEKIVNDEVKMAQAQLYRAAKNSLELHKMCKFVDELEGWCQAKITIAAENLEAVKNYIEYEMVSATLAESIEEEFFNKKDDKFKPGTTQLPPEGQLKREWIRTLMDRGMGRIEAGEIADKMCAAKIAPKSM